MDKKIEENYRKISENVRRIRLNKGLSQLEVALEMGIKSVAFYSNCENLKYNKHFNLEHLFKLSEIFGVDVCEFFKDIRKE